MTTNPDRQSVLNEDEEYRRFLDPNRYAQMNERVREKASNKKSLIAIAISCAVALACVAYMVFLFNSDHTMPAVATSLDEQHFVISDEDMEMLAAEGYDGEQLTSDAGEFMEKFFTFDMGSVEDGSWEKSFMGYVDEGGIVPIMENLLYIRTQDGWGDVFRAHPYYQSKWVSNNSISWNILPTETVNVPYCDVYATIDGTPIDRYFLNSPDLEINRYVNCYRIVFDADGKITSIKKLRGFTRQLSVDEAAMASDKENAEKATEVERKKAETIAKEKAAKEAEEKARQEAAEAEEKRKAEEEEKKAAEEAAKKEQENANKPSNGTSSSGSSNTNTGGNTGGNQNGNTNTGEDDNTGGNANTGDSSTQPPSNGNAPTSAQELAAA